MRPCVLIVENDKDSLDTYRKILERYGIDVIVANCLEDVLPKIEKNYIDCVHMDILFDGKVDGLDVICAIKRQFEKIPVVVISGFIDQGYRNKAKMIGIDEFVREWYSKPCDYEIIALDTLKLINDQTFLSIKTALIDYIGIDTLSQKENELLANALTSIPSTAKIIELKPPFLLNKLNDILDRIESNIETKNVLKIKKYFLDFKKLVKRHITDYFSTSINHSLLADYLLKFCSQVNPNILDKSLTKTMCEGLKSFLASFEKHELSEREVYVARVALENTSVIPITLSNGTSDDVKKLSILMEEYEEEE